ncbi:uncharacterized protein YndB with AHSA1/START domain [Deinococcus metalli]|uniref:Uncharacterized protein YndB with AHSA1/START domain n=1 Tax=Deinococcus metalli TaxID=1141878 RepID=A0A7W8KEN6_9DEIO|nr:SRPBCC family protein [Deinococcus metalli]MBB5376795.1 uncharacterized protein YndB with AHSA1/START domain [Deinococcus metalli]GHF45401.1 hypothetical protein GCM10017781_22240 [Deinococcus metalli]
MTRDRAATGGFEHTVTVRATPAELWTVWTDVAAWPTWDTPLVEALLGGPFRAGTTGRLTDRSGRTSRFTITEVDGPRAYTFETALPLARLVVRRAITAERPGSLDMTHHVHFTGALAALWARLLGPAFRSQLPGVMESLRRRVEGVS